MTGVVEGYHPLFQGWYGKSSCRMQGAFGKMRASADGCALTCFGKGGGRAAMPGKMKTASANVRVLAGQTRNWNKRKGGSEMKNFREKKFLKKLGKVLGCST